MNFHMKKPCNNCPFLKKDGINSLGARRAKEIIDQVEEYGFVCHKTVDYSLENGEVDSSRKQCAGSMILSTKSNTFNPYINLHKKLLNSEPELSKQEYVVDTEEEFIKIQTL